MTQFYAAIEAGGTKFNCAVFDQAGNIVAQARFPTLTPQDTLEPVIDFFVRQQDSGVELVALGIASFGPLDLNPESATYGSITKTPKPNWSNVALRSTLSSRLGIPVFIDTDVNGAAIAEATIGAGQNKAVVVYVTVGTGVGGGVVVNGSPLHGLIHPEIGHMLVPGDSRLTGQCPFHSNCIEGFASGKAIGQMWGQPAETLPDEHPAWELQATTMSQLCHNLMMSFSPNVIVLGGGVMAKPGLLEKIIEKTGTSVNDYLVLPKGQTLSNLIVPPSLGNDSGLYGAFILASQSI